MNAVERTAAKRLLQAWDDAVGAWRACWTIRGTHDFGSPAELQATEMMFERGTDFSRLSRWTMHGPATVACGGTF
jgi:hypothetical protein